MSNAPQSPSEFARFVQEGGFDFIDFGCSAGGSIRYAREKLGGSKGLGIDRDPAKIDQTQKAGFDAVAYDILQIPEDRKLVKFVILSHFLEHVPNPADVQLMIRKACAIASDFVYIQQPFFDADGYLMGLGLKCYWSDWRSHHNPMSSLEFWRAFRNVKKAGKPITYSIHQRGRIADSNDPCILPLSAPVDSHSYTKDMDAKPSVHFTEAIWQETVCLITLEGVNHAEMVKRIGIDHTVLDEHGTVFASARPAGLNLKSTARKALHALPAPVQDSIRAARRKLRGF